ncbi:hypothetical protein ACSSS7_007804 [Eimeria intestinalis]
MTAARRPKDAVQISSLIRHHASIVKAVGDLDREGSFVGFNDLLFRHRHLHKAPAGISVLAVVLAALALTYLLVTCMGRLSRGFKLGSQQSRLLASNSPSENEEACLEPPGNGYQGAGIASGEGAAPEGAVAAETPGEPGGAGTALAAPAGPMRRHLPPGLLTLVGRTIHLLEEPAHVLTSLISSLGPEHSLNLVQILCKIAILEISAFATVPLCLQPLRQRVAHVYIELIEHVLSTASTAEVASQRDWGSHLRHMQVLLEGLAHIPPETENLTSGNYLTIMEIQQQLCHWTLSQLLKVFYIIGQVKTVYPTEASDKIASQQGSVLSSLFIARRLQVLHSATLRYWLFLNQRSLAIPVIFGAGVLNQARYTAMGDLHHRLSMITSAVAAAGGQPASQYAPLPLTPEEKQQLLHQQFLMHQFGHHPHPVPPLAHPSHAYGPADIHFAPPPGLYPHPFAPPLYSPLHVPPPQADQIGAQSLSAPPGLIPPPQQHLLLLSQPLLQTPYMPQSAQPPQADAQPQVTLDLAAQDLLFPALHPYPQLLDQPEPPAPTLQIQLPEVYQRLDPLLPPLGGPSTSSSAQASSEGWLGASFSQSQPSGSPDPPQTPQASSPQTLTDTHQDSSRGEDDARGLTLDLGHNTIVRLP